MKRARRRWWTSSVTLAAVLIVLGAFLSGLFQLAVMALPGYQDDIASAVGRAVGRPIDIGGISLGWSGLAPRLDLTDITLYDESGEQSALTAQRLSLNFGLLRLVQGNITPTRLDLSGLRLAIEVDAAGKVSIRGLDSAGPARSREDWLRDLSRFQRVRLRDCEVELSDVRLGDTVERFRLARAEIEQTPRGAEATADLLLPADIGSGAQMSAEIIGDLQRAESWTGGWKLTIDNFTGSPWLQRKLAADTQVFFSRAKVMVSGDLAGGRSDAIQLQFSADSISARRGQEVARLLQPALDARVKLSADGWLAEIKRFTLNGSSGRWPDTQAGLRYTRLADGGYEIESDASFLRLQDLVGWLPMLPSAAGPGAGLERLRGVSGELRGTVLRLRRSDAAMNYSLRADVEGFGVAAEGGKPGFAGLSGEVSATETGGRLALKEAPFELEFARVFDHPAAFERLGGELLWTRKLEGWQVQAPTLGWQLAGSQGEGRMDLFIPTDPEASPQLQLSAQFSAEDVMLLKPFMPIHWGEPLRHWLDQAVGGGRVTAGSLKIEGRLHDFPFTEKPGVFALDIDVEDGKLAFAPDWPRAERLSARLKFRGRGLDITADGGQLLGSRVEHVTAAIADFHEPLLVIDGKAAGSTVKLYDILRASPLAAKFSGLLDHTIPSGPAKVALHLEIPLRDAHHVGYRGTVQLDDVDLKYRSLEEPVRDINGEIAFSSSGVSSDQLTASFYELPLVAVIVPHDNGGLLKADLDFRPDPAGKGVSSLLPAIVREPLSGASHWQASFDIGASAPPVLRLQSNLQGTAVALPAPLGKPADLAVPIEVAISGSSDYPLQIDVDYREWLGADLNFASIDGKLAPRRSLLRLGGGGAPVAQQDGFYIIGDVADLDPMAWIGALAGGDGSGERSPVQQVDLQVRHLVLGRESVNDVHLHLRPDSAGWNAVLTGAGADGQLRWTGGAAGTVNARFKRLHLYPQSRREEETGPATVSGEPLNPTRLPVVDFICDDLQLGKARLGRAVFESRRIADGQKIQTLNVDGGEMDLSASGQWRRTGGASSAELSFVLGTTQTGDTLEGLGFAQSLDAQRGRIQGDLKWTPDAKGIAWAQAGGKVAVDFENGALKTVEPGAGRMLGLLNFTALPRRLTLDFRDVVDKGLSFDRITGSFVLGDGIATTDDVDINTPSLRMEMRGRVGLAARDYDQRVTVYPDVSSGVTLGALLLGGPAAGLIALIAQEVLDGPADKISQFSYQVTGSWDNPQVHRAGAATN